MIEEKDSAHLDVYPLDHLFEKIKYANLLRKGKYLSLPAKAFLKTMKPDIEQGK